MMMMSVYCTGYFNKLRSTCYIFIECVLVIIIFIGAVVPVLVIRFRSVSLEGMGNEWLHYQLQGIHCDTYST